MALIQVQLTGGASADCPGFTNCKPKYKRPDGLFPFVRLKCHTGRQYSMADTFQKITKLYGAREQEREARRHKKVAQAISQV